MARNVVDLVPTWHVVFDADITATQIFSGSVCVGRTRKKALSSERLPPFSLGTFFPVLERRVGGKRFTVSTWSDADLRSRT